MSTTKRQTTKTRTTKRATTRPPHLELHRVIVAMSFWGTSVRLLLVVVLQAILSVVRMLADSASTSSVTTLSNELGMIVYVVGLFAILDAGYVMVHRSLSLGKYIDQLILFLIEIVALILFFVPQIAVVDFSLSVFAIWLPLAILFLLAVRILLGFLDTMRSK